MHRRTRKGLIYSIVQVALRKTPITAYHSRQITLSEKMLIIATGWNGKLYLLASFLKFGQNSNFLRTYGLNYYYACHTKCFNSALTSTGSLNDKLYQVSNTDRLWPMNSVQIRNVLIFPTLLNISLLYEFDIRNLLNLSLCISQCSDLVALVQMK